MAVSLMTCRCGNCGRAYPYDPSVGNFGQVCPHCHTPRGMQLPRPKLFRKGGKNHGAL